MLKPRRKFNVRKVYPVAEHKMQIDKIIQYGLRNKTEFEKFNALLKKYRRIVFKYEKTDSVYIDAIDKLVKKSIIADKESDILNLTIDDFLARRLQSLVYEQKLSKTIYEARKHITDGHIFVNGIKVKRPSLLININSEISYT